MPNISKPKQDIIAFLNGCKPAIDHLSFGDTDWPRRVAQIADAVEQQSPEPPTHGSGPLSKHAAWESKKTLALRMLFDEDQQAGRRTLDEAAAMERNSHSGCARPLPRTTIGKMLKRVVDRALRQVLSVSYRRQSSADHAKFVLKMCSSTQRDDLLEVQELRSAMFTELAKRSTEDQLLCDRYFFSAKESRPKQIDTSLRTAEFLAASSTLISVVAKIEDRIAKVREAREKTPPPTIGAEATSNP